MKVLQINVVYPNGSTGKIAKGIQQLCREKGIENIVAYRYKEKSAPEYDDTMTVSSWWDCHVHNRLVRYLLVPGLFSRVKTARFLKKVDKFAPDIIHLHNIHGSFINFPLLFEYVKKHDIKLIWTLHDCWAFTGYCPYFTAIDCDKWHTDCSECPVAKGAVGGIINAPEYVLKKKRQSIGGVKDMTVVTPSVWLADLAKQSYLAQYPIMTIHNGIDLSIFKPTESDFRQKYGLENKKILLGVAFDWGFRKGLDIFVRLAEDLPDEYAIVMVGTNDEVDKQLPQNIISVHRTNNQQELAQIYSAADLFVNPTREDNFPTVNIESLACGTPVLTFKTGGSPEALTDKCGSVVEYDNYGAFKAEIERICTEKPYTAQSCVSRAAEFDMNNKFGEYVALYESKNKG